MRAPRRRLATWQGAIPGFRWDPYLRNRLPDLVLQQAKRPYIHCIYRHISSPEILVKTVIDLDLELTEEAAKVLGTTTKKDTVHAALAAAIAEAERRARRQARLLD